MANRHVHSADRLEVAESVAVTVSTHMFLVWAQLAIKSEHTAHEERIKMLANKTNGSFLRSETEATLVTLVAAASSLEALRHEISQKVSPSSLARWEEARRGSTANDVLATLRLAFDLPSDEWPKRFDELFKLRNQAVHPKWRSSETVWHPSGLHKTSHEFVEFSSERAADAVQLLLDLLGQCIERPTPELAAWAEGVSPAVEELREMRRTRVTRRSG